MKLVQSRPGFTLLETVITLTIMCSLVFIASINLKDYRSRMEEKQAIEWMKSTLKNTFNYCYLHERMAFFRIDPVENSLEVNATEPSFSKKYYKKIFLPKTLKIVRHGAIKYLITKSGHGAAMSFKLRSDLTKHTYSYKVQMDWGEIIETKT